MNSKTDHYQTCWWKKTICNPTDSRNRFIVALDIVHSHCAVFYVIPTHSCFFLFLFPFHIIHNTFILDLNAEPLCVLVFNHHRIYFAFLLLLLFALSIALTHTSTVRFASSKSPENHRLVQSICNNIHLKITRNASCFESFNSNFVVVFTTIGWPLLHPICQNKKKCEADFPYSSFFHTFHTINAWQINKSFYQFL